MEDNKCNYFGKILHLYSSQNKVEFVSLAIYDEFMDWIEKLSLSDAIG